MREPQINSLPLHDAVLRSVEYSWQQKNCRVSLSVFVDAGKDARPHTLEFHGVTSISLPHHESWGPSAFIHSASQGDGAYKIQMQSGDVLEVTASGFTFSAL